MLQVQYLTAQEDTLGVEVKGQIPVLLCCVFCRAVFVDASIVDCNVQASQLSYHSLNHPASPMTFSALAHKLFQEQVFCTSKHTPVLSTTTDVL